MSRLAIGPAGKLDLSGQKFLPGPIRRPLATLGLDQAWLWHRGSAYASKYLTIIPVGTSGPEWFEGENGWGVKGSLLKVPKVIFLDCYDETFATAWLNANFESLFGSAGIAVRSGGNSFPFLAGCPLDRVDSVVQDGAPINPRFVFVPAATDLFRGGEVFNVVISPYRTRFVGTTPSDPQIGSDYTTPGDDTTSFGGYDFFPDSGGPNPHEGFYVASGPAADDLANMNAIADRCFKWKTVFYQADAEYPGLGVGATDSSLISESALNALLGPRTFRVPFSSGNLTDAFSKMQADALAFFS